LVRFQIDEGELAPVPPQRLDDPAIDRVGSTAHVVTTMVSPIIAPARPRSVGDYRAGRGANQPACNRSAGRAASQTTYKRAAAATNQCAAQNAILPAVCTPRKRQCHHNHDQCVAHLLLLSN
jgi:hypothetical protein